MPGFQPNTRVSASELVKQDPRESCTCHSLKSFSLSHYPEKQNTSTPPFKQWLDLTVLKFSMVKSYGDYLIKVMKCITGTSYKGIFSYWLLKQALAKFVHDSQNVV